MNATNDGTATNDQATAGLEPAAAAPEEAAKTAATTATTTATTTAPPPTTPTTRRRFAGKRRTARARATKEAAPAPVTAPSPAGPIVATLPPMTFQRIAPHPDMVWIPGGSFVMGSDRHYPEEAPAHPVTVDGFWIDRFAVTNADFARFVAETGYVTVAERTPAAADYPGADPALLVPGSAVFRRPARDIDRRDCLQWWTYVPGACWRRPEGPGSDLTGRASHPVVHVAFADVEMYAIWSGKQIPSEAEWERAARGGLEEAEFCWGNDFMPEGLHLANTWQGEFPWENEVADGFEGTAPVGSYPANGYGLYDMAGNVWEWTGDWFSAGHDAPADGKSCCMPHNPRGPERDAGIDAGIVGAVGRRVVKGGSFLCAPSYCLRYRPAARFPQAVDTSTCHIGFRLIVRPDR